VRGPAAAAAALLLLAAGAAADEVRTTDGRLLEGKVLEETESSVRIRLRFGGEVTLSRAEVRSVERKDLPEEALAKRRAALAAGDVEGRWALHLEAKAQGLRKASEELLDEILKADPEHAPANEARGNVRWEGRWVKPAERDRLAAERERAEKAKEGLVEYKGRWVTPEERDALERGLVFHAGRWMSEREAKALQGLVEYRGSWVKKDELESLLLRDSLVEAAGVPLTLAQSERFSVATIWNQAATAQVLQDAEKAYQEFAGIFAVQPGERLFDDPFNRKARRCTIVVLEKEAQYSKFLDGLLRFHVDLKKVLRPERVDLMRKQKGFYLVDPDCWIVGYQFPHPPEQMRHAVVHKLSHVMLFRRGFKGVAWPNWWLVEGLGSLQEVSAFGNVQSYCITTGYGEPAAGDKFIGESWKAEAKRLVATGGDRRAAEIFPRGLNDLEPLDLVKSWSFVHYLVAVDREKFARTTALLKTGVPATEAIEKVYGATAAEMDDRWREFVKRTY
jgi:hypothetical protein